MAIQAAQYNPQPTVGNVGLFYAGGVDSSYSLLSHLDELDILITSFGFDFTFADEEMNQSIQRNGRFARRFRKTLVPIETNYPQFVNKLGISHLFVFGATLACMGLLMGLKRCYIASSHSAANMKPEGSHPVLDYLFSNGVTEIVHDDVSVSRFEKTKLIAQHPDFLRNLCVCWDEPNENCGSCSKCLRTMVAMRLLGVEGPFPPLHELQQLRDMAADTEYEYVLELILAAQAKGDIELVCELKKGLRRQDCKEAVRYVDRALFSGRLKGLYSRLTSTRDDVIKVNSRPDLDIGLASSSPVSISAGVIRRRKRI